MDEVNRSWEEIVTQWRRETDPRRRKELERDLHSALERAGFQKFSRRVQQSSDEQTEDK
jgi:hypothetical protein